MGRPASLHRHRDRGWRWLVAIVEGNAYRPFGSVGAVLVAVAALA